MTEEPKSQESIGGEMARLLAAAVVGGIVGASLGLLLAPKSGMELRSELKEKASTAAEKAQTVGVKAKELVEAAKQKIEEHRVVRGEAATEEEAEAGAETTEA